MHLYRTWFMCAVDITLQFKDMYTQTFLLFWCTEYRFNLICVLLSVGDRQVILRVNLWSFPRGFCTYSKALQQKSYTYGKVRILMQTKRFLNRLEIKKRSISTDEITFPKSYHWLVSYLSCLNRMPDLIQLKNSSFKHSILNKNFVTSLIQQFNLIWKLRIRSKITCRRQKLLFKT